MHVTPAPFIQSTIAQWIQWWILLCSCRSVSNRFDSVASENWRVSENNPVFCLAVHQDAMMLHLSHTLNKSWIKAPVDVHNKCWLDNICSRVSARTRSVGKRWSALSLPIWSSSLNYLQLLIRTESPTALGWRSACPCLLSSRWDWRSTGDQRSTGSWRCARSSTEPNRTGEIPKWSSTLMLAVAHSPLTRMCIRRYIFLFDKVVIVCKRKGYSYELKEIIELQSYKMSDDPMNNRDMKKVRAALDPEVKRLHRLISLAMRSPAKSGRAGNESSTPSMLSLNWRMLVMVSSDIQ